MEIHGICIVKNEADILAECLRASANWCDHIYVLDNGSTDGTWEIAQALEAELSQVTAWKSEAVPFSDGLRARVFNEFRDRSRPGDWWCRLDADEFYVDDPRVFLGKIPQRYDVVWTASFSYYLTDRDADAYREDPARYADTVPVEEKLRYYVNHWGEPRFFRTRPELVWDEDEGFPPFVYGAPAYPVRIWVKHFPYRSPQQIERRLADRQEAIARGVFVHEAVADWADAVAGVATNRGMLQNAGPEFVTGRWEDRIVPAASLQFDAHDRKLVVNEDLMPPLPTASTMPQRIANGARRLSRRAAAVVRERAAARAD